MFKKVLWSMLIIMFLVGFVGCEKKEQVIKFGAILPLTGEGGIYGTDLKKGSDLALDEINQSGGISGKKLLLIYEDSKADPKTAVSAMNKLVNVDKVSIVLGDMFSSPTLAIAPIAEQSKIVLLSPTSSAEAVPNSGDYIFTIFPSDTYEGQILAEYAFNKLGKKEAFILSAQAQSMINIKETFKKTFEKLGGKVIAEDEYPEGTKDFRALLEKLTKISPDIVFAPGYLTDLGLLLKQAKELRTNAQFLTISTAYDEKVFEFGDAVDGLVFTAPFFDAESNYPVIAKFIASFKTKYNQTPNIWSAYGYDVVNIAVQAYKNSLANGTQIKDELLAIKDYPGITGKTSFKSNGGVDKLLRIYTIKEGKYHPLEM